MKKLIFLLLTAIVLMLVLLAGALFYIDLTGHKGFTFGVKANGETVGTMRLEKYITEDKIVYKTKTKRSDSLRFSQLNENLYIDKGSKDIVRLDKEAVGVYGEKVQVAFYRENKNNEYVYLDYPKFISVQGGYINRAASLYIPGDPVLCLAIMEKYNFWLKGKQFFDVAVAVEGAVAPILDKIEVYYVKDEYVQIMGKKIQAEIFAIKSPTIPEVKFALSKFYHELLFIEDTAFDERIELVSIVDSLLQRIKGHISVFVNSFILKEETAPDESQVKGGISGSYKPIQTGVEGINKEEIFINDGTSIISGKILRSKENDGINPIILIVADDGPVSSGEELLLEALSKHLVGLGYNVASLDYLRDTARETSFYLLDDETKVKTISLFLDHLNAKDNDAYGPLILVGYKGGGYIALSVQDKELETAGCIQLEMPGLVWGDLDESLAENFIEYAYGTSSIQLKNNKHLETVRKYTLDYIKNILNSEQDVLTFKRFNLPLREYREYLERDYSLAVQRFSAPILFLYSKEQKKYYGSEVNNIKKQISGFDKRSQAFEVRNSNQYFGEVISNDGIKGYKLRGDFLEQIDKWLKDILN